MSEMFSTETKVAVILAYRNALDIVAGLMEVAIEDVMGNNLDQLDSNFQETLRVWQLKSRTIRASIEAIEFD